MEALGSCCHDSEDPQLLKNSVGRRVRVMLGTFSGKALEPFAATPRVHKK